MIIFFDELQLKHHFFIKQPFYSYQYLCNLSIRLPGSNGLFIQLSRNDLILDHVPRLDHISQPHYVVIQEIACKMYCHQVAKQL